MILALETSTKNCSVALYEQGELLHFKEETGDRFIHGERLHCLIEELLHEKNLGISDLSGISVGKGPGSYTGLRIGVSTAKGLAYALKLPLYAQPTLGCFDFTACSNGWIITALDARRDEVYAQVWRKDALGIHEVGGVEAVLLDENAWSILDGPVSVLSDCSEKMAQYLGSSRSLWTFYPSSFPSAQFMKEGLPRSEEEAVDTAYFEPFYLKDFVAEKSKKSYF
jgi:tRNA threonylcarbamoyladenosine biosynthesis protein TsaB